jgi:hypothetical protein
MKWGGKIILLLRALYPLAKEKNKAIAFATLPLL